MGNPKVLISDKMSPLAEQVFIKREIDVDVKTSLTCDDLVSIISRYDGLAIRSSTKVDRELLYAGEKLQVIGRAGIGIDNVDVAVASQRGVVVMNTPFGNSITTAEHTISMLLAIAREIPQANTSTHNGLWEKTRFMGVEVAGKVLGVIGCGNIGSVVADRAQGLKMKVIGYDPFLSAEQAKILDIEKVELNELFKKADFISLHTPLTEKTRGILNSTAFEQMKDGVRIINCARGGLIVEDDLKRAIIGGKVGGAALDVFATEPAIENTLFGIDSVIATPHLGASTVEAQEKVAIQVAEQMADYLLAGAVTNAINMPAVSAKEAGKLQPYMTLAQQLGSFAGQATQTAYKDITIDDIKNFRALHANC